MFKRYINGRKQGGMSVIITSSIALIILSLFFANLIISATHIATRTKLSKLASTQVEVISKNRLISGNMYSFLNKDIAKYKPILKEYEIIYKIYDVNNGEIDEIYNIEGNSNLNINLSEGQIVEIKIKQTTISQLQKITNIIKKSQEETMIAVSEKGVVK